MTDRPKQDPGETAAPSIESYRDYQAVVQGQTSESLRSLYDRLYFERHVGGKEVASSYFDTDGLAPTRYTRRPLALAEIRPGHRVLDVGCGRGELVFQAAALGADATGIDYSQSAIDIANVTRMRHSDAIQAQARFVCDRAQHLPFASGSFDRVFMLDVVEHVSKEELAGILAEIRRVLHRDGLLIVHTTENVWARTYGYRLHATVRRLKRRKPPPHPVVAEYEHVKADPDLDERKVLLHINEQSVPNLKLALSRARFRSRVWLTDDRNLWLDKPGIRNRTLALAYRALGMKYLFGRNIYAVASPGRRPPRSVKSL